MPAYNFKKRFEDIVIKLIKRQTIRAKRKYPPRVGQTAYLFTGMRTKKCKRLGEYPIKSVNEIRISKTAIVIEISYNKWRGLNKAQKEKLARADGFYNYTEFINFFISEHGLPFKGDLIKW